MQQPMQQWSPNQAPEKSHTWLNLVCFSQRGIQKKKKKEKVNFQQTSHKQLMKESICLTALPLKKASLCIYNYPPTSTGPFILTGTIGMQTLHCRWPVL